MNALKSLGSVGLIFLLASSATTMAAPIEAAAEAYAKGEFGLAAREYETAIASTGPSAGLLYNLGIAQKQAGETGSAAVALRRSLMLDPRSIDTRMALSDLERSQGVPMAPAQWPDRLAELVPLVPVLVLGFGVFWLGMFLVLGAVALRRRPWMLASGILVGVCGATLFVAGYLSDPRFAWRSAAVVIDGVTMGNAPAERSEAVAKLPPASMVGVVRESGSWAYCRLPDGRSGWLPKSSIVALVPSA